MKSPFDTVRGRIEGFDERAQELIVRVPYTDYATLFRREYKTCLVQLEDSRPLSDKQRRACYALLREISGYTGMGLDPCKEWMKIKFLAEEFGETADKIFSLGSANMSLVCAFQRFLVRFVIDWEIPCKVSLLNYVDDVNDYIYACLSKKVCCICGKKADLHHSPALGRGIDREKINHVGLTAEPLCRIHHGEAHTIGLRTFEQKYHIAPVQIDSSIAKIYGLHHGRKERSKNE